MKYDGLASVVGGAGAVGGFVLVMVLLFASATLSLYEPIPARQARVSARKVEAATEQAAAYPVVLTEPDPEKPPVVLTEPASENPSVVHAEPGPEKPPAVVTEPVAGNPAAIAEPPVASTEGAPAETPIVEYTLTLQQDAPIPQAGIVKYAGTRNGCLYGFRGFEQVHQDVSDGCLVFGEADRKILVGFTLFESEGGFLPPTTKILEAKLCLHKNPLTAPPIFDLRDLVSPWDPTDVTWALAAQGKPWNTPGGDGEKGPPIRFQNGEEPDWIEADVTANVQRMQASGKNFGWLIEAFAEGDPPRPYPSLGSLSSSAHTDPALRPKLSLKIQCPKFSVAAAEAKPSGKEE